MAEAQKEANRLHQRSYYSILQVAILFVVISLLGIGYTGYVQRQADARYERLLAEQAKREKQIRDERDRAAAIAREQGLKFFCSWLYVQIDPKLGAPTTVRGERVIAANTELYNQIGCKKATP